MVQGSKHVPALSLALAKSQMTPVRKFRFTDPFPTRRGGAVAHHRSSWSEL